MLLVHSWVIPRESPFVLAPPREMAPAQPGAPSWPDGTHSSAAQRPRYAHAKQEGLDGALEDDCRDPQGRRLGDASSKARAEGASPGVDVGQMRFLRGGGRLDRRHIRRLSTTYHGRSIQIGHSRGRTSFPSARCATRQRATPTTREAC